MLLRNWLKIGGASLFMMVSVAIAAESDSSAETSVVEPFRMLDWQGFNLVSTLDDGTSLYQYVAQSALPDRAETASGREVATGLRVSFLPRFQCSPLISVVGILPDNLTAGERVALVRDFNQIELTIDEEPLPFPALVEFEDREILSFYDATLQRRLTLRILVELGSRLQIKFGEGSQRTLSLLGSRRVLETALGRCRKHS